MRIGIDASNLRGGGGVTHLAALLSHADPHEAGIDRIVVWGRGRTLECLGPRPWLVKSECTELERSMSATAWRARILPKLAPRECDLLFAPGGLCTDRFHPVVTMSRNMLPFQWAEMRRYGPSRMLLRLAALRVLQTRSFRRADGTIFLSQFAQETVTRAAGPLRGRTAVIPHGVDEGFRRPPRPARAIAEYSTAKPFRLLVVSIVDVYKHAWNVAEAVARLRREGLPVAVDFVGGTYPAALRKLLAVIRRHDPEQTFLRYAGNVEHALLPVRYHDADAFIFASTCENLPNILLEAMAAGLPIACSRRRPMAEILGPAGVYFDPLQPDEIVAALQRLVDDFHLRDRIANEAYVRASDYSWSRCAKETLGFLADVASDHPSTHSQRS